MRVQLSACVHTQAVRAVRCVYTAVNSGTASIGNDGAVAVDCDSRRAVGPIRTIRGVYMTQLNRLQRLAALSTPHEWSFYV